MYVIFLILLQNYEKAVHVNNYMFFWKGLCFNYFISTLMALRKGFLKAIYTFFYKKTIFLPEPQFS